MGWRGAIGLLLIGGSGLGCGEPFTFFASSGAGGTGADGSGATSSSANNGGSGATSGGGSEPGVEDCLDAADNDGDGAVDCADSDCNSFSCVPAYAGAIAYVTVADSCGDPLVARNLLACGSGCGCTPGNGGSCSVDFTVYDDLECMGSVTYAGTGPLACYDNSDGDRSFIGQPEPNGDAGCDITQATVGTVPSTACGLPAAGACTDLAQICVPAAATKWCALIDGDDGCDAPYQWIGIVYDDDGTTSCNCACVPDEQSCDAANAYVADDNNSCNSGNALPMDGACHASPSQNSYQVPDVSASIDNCWPWGEPASGSSSMTLCCLP